MAISSDFYYFGRDAIKIPERFNCLIAPTQGHKNTDDARLMGGFWKWLTNVASKRGRMGTPFNFGDPVCECNRKAKLLRGCYEIAVSSWRHRHGLTK